LRSETKAQKRPPSSKVVSAADSVLNAQLESWGRVIAEQSKEPFFKKVLQSQIAWVRRTGAYLNMNNLC